MAVLHCVLFEVTHQACLWSSLCTVEFEERLNIKEAGKKREHIKVPLD
jgi:hypothetical protein